MGASSCDRSRKQKLAPMGRSYPAEGFLGVSIAAPRGDNGGMNT